MCSVLSCDLLNLYLIGIVVVKVKKLELLKWTVSVMCKCSILTLNQFLKVTAEGHNVTLKHHVVLVFKQQYMYIWGYTYIAMMYEYYWR
jgi:hypothetical protein